MKAWREDAAGPCLASSLILAHRMKAWWEEDAVGPCLATSLISTLNLTGVPITPSRGPPNCIGNGSHRWVHSFSPRTPYCWPETPIFGIPPSKLDSRDEPRTYLGFGEGRPGGEGSQCARSWKHTTPVPRELKAEVCRKQLLSLIRGRCSRTSVSWHVGQMYRWQRSPRATNRKQGAICWQWSQPALNEEARDTCAGSVSICSALRRVAFHSQQNTSANWWLSYS